MTDPTKRFSDRVDDYQRARPGYPVALMSWLQDQGALHKGCDVVDVGAGTGLLTLRLVEAGARVVAVEPSGPMRDALVARLGESVLAVDGTAEATGLPAASADLVTAGQAFHWFHPAPTASEWRRVLRPGGRVCLVWNDRGKANTPFMAAYEALVDTHGTDYRQVRSGKVDAAAVAAFFHPCRVVEARFDNAQPLDHAGLKARVLSTSYAPGPEHPGRPALLVAIDRLFEEHQVGGLVSMAYATCAYLGALEP